MATHLLSNIRIVQPGEGGRTGSVLVRDGRIAACLESASPFPEVLGPGRVTVIDGNGECVDERGESPAGQAEKRTD